MARPRSRTAGKKLAPFSLIFKPEELNALRRIARKEDVAIATIIRRAIHTIIAQTDSGLIKQMIEREVEAFLDHLAQRYPTSRLTSSRRIAFENRLVKELV